MIKTEKEFLELLPKLAQHNADLNELGKTVKTEKNDLKEFMLLEDIESAEAGGWEVTLSETTKTSMDEAKLLEIIQDLVAKAEGSDVAKFEHLIELKPTVNEDLLEDLIYKGELDGDIIHPAVVTSTSHTMRFKVAKKKGKK